MPPLWTRRQLLQYSGAGLTVAALGSTALALNAPRGKVESVTTVSNQGDSYHGWPTLARRKNGQLWVVCSGGRETHVCPFGRAEAMTSDDDGRTWTWPRVLLDGAIDDRDAGLLETAKGSLLVTTFTSLAYEAILLDAEKRKPEATGA